MPDFILTFGRGLNAATRTSDVHVSECVRGENFDIDLDSRGFSRRKPFDKIATTPNAQRINGFIQLVKKDETTSALVQSGDTVYTWDGATTFVAVGTVSSAARLRGPEDHNFTLSEVVIITDLSKTEQVKQWDGTNLTNLAHDLGGPLRAKYCVIHGERAYYVNVQTSTDTPHIILGSARQDHTSLSTSNRPVVSSSLDAPFFIPVSNLKPINGAKKGLGVLMFSTNDQLYKLTGSSAFDFDLDEFYLGSGVAGDEAIANIGNDMIFGLPARIETLSGTLNFGDVETDDASRWIKPLIEDVKSWTIVYDQRRQMVYCVPDGGNIFWVLHKSALANQDSRSPWSKWTTLHSSSFQPTAIMAMRRPTDDLRTVYFGDTVGNIYELNGGGAQDGGSSDITAFRESGLIRNTAIPQGQIYDVSGYINYRKLAAATVTITFQHSGVAIFDQPITIEITAGGGFAVFNSGASGGTFHFNSGSSGATAYFGQRFTQRLERQTFPHIAGQSNHFQARIEVSGNTDFEIDEIGFSFEIKA